MPGPCRAKCNHRLRSWTSCSARPLRYAERDTALCSAMTSTQVTEFEALRPHLMSVAYRLTGTVADAEDIVQEAWLRWNSAGRRHPRFAGLADHRGEPARSGPVALGGAPAGDLHRPLAARTGRHRVSIRADPLSAVVARRGRPVRGDGGAGAAQPRPAGRVRAARRVRRAVRRSGRRVGHQRRSARPPAGVAGPQGRRRGAAAGTRSRRTTRWSAS